MRLEEILPDLRRGVCFKREDRYYKMSFVTINEKQILKLWSSPNLKTTYRLTSDDILADDWKKVD